MTVHRSSADLHMHSICSDGKLSPRQLVEKAVSNGVNVMSLTDHDTMEGIDEAIKAAQDLNVLLIPGVEISSESTSMGNLHILGYFPPAVESKDLKLQLSKIRSGRHVRGKEMLRKLEVMGIRLEWNKVLEIAGEAAPGRAHIAEAMVAAGSISNHREAFTGYIENNGPAYAEGVFFPPQDAIKLIKSAGGVAILAHPWVYKDSHTLIRKLTKLGLDGIEVYHSWRHIKTYANLGATLSLVMTGGSDYHGNKGLLERGPGCIQFSKARIRTFLEFVRIAWASDLERQLQHMAAEMQPSINESRPLLIWATLEKCAHGIAQKLGLKLHVTGSTQYRTIRLTRTK